MAYSLGIDLGTTLSAAATARDGLIEIVQLGEQTTTMPSIVVVRADVEVLVGDAAERESANEPARTARGFKRRLGDPNPIVLGGKPYGAEALLAHLLRAIVARVSEEAGGPPDAIVLTHPASYGPDKIALLEGAVRQAGIENVTFLTEPEAAAIHDDQRDPLTVGSVVAVYDFGGGTFDAAILRKTETGFEEIGTSEEMEHLGGIDFDEAFSSSVVGFVSANGIAVDADDPATAAALVRLREEGRRAKEALSSESETTVHVDLPGFQTELPLTREDFEDLIRPHIAETIGALGPGHRERGPHIPRAGPHPARSAGRHGSRWWPRWSARRRIVRSRSMRTRRIRSRWERPSWPSSGGWLRRRTPRQPRLRPGWSARVRSSGWKRRPRSTRSPATRSPDGAPPTAEAAEAATDARRGGGRAD